MRLTYLFSIVSVLPNGYGQEAGNFPPSTSSFVGDGESCPPGDLQGDEMKKKVTLEACRRNPTWRGYAVDHEECRRLTGWKPRDHWWRVAKNHTCMDDTEKELASCIDEHFRRAREDRLWWALCDENNNDENCLVPPTRVIGHYIRQDDDADDDENGDLVIIKNILTEQEAYGLESLQKCMLKLLDNDDDDFFEERTFDEDDEDADIYKNAGGNIVSYMTGLLQLYLPGVASSLHRSMSVAHRFAGWDVPTPNSMGMRNSEFLKYHRTGRLGVHDDAGSIMTVSVSLSNPEEYYGGHFHLNEEDALFKVPRLSGVVFLAETSHGITQILGGTRKVFVAELWDEDDTPVCGFARPEQKEFDELKKERTKTMQTNDKNAMYEQVGLNEAVVGVQGGLGALAENSGLM